MLCHLTPAPKTMRHEESGPGHHSLGISIRGQLLLPSLDNLLQGLGNHGIHVCRASHDGSASAPIKPRPLAQSTRSDQHADCCARFKITLELPRRTGLDVTGASPQYVKDGPLRRPRRHRNRLQGSDMPPPSAQRRVASECITLVPPSTIKGRDQGRFEGRGGGRLDLGSHNELTHKSTDEHPSSPTA